MKNQRNHVRLLYDIYRKAPGYEYAKSLLDQMEDDSCVHLGEYNTKLIMVLAEKLGLDGKIVDITKERSFPANIFTNEAPAAYLNKATYCNLETCKHFGATLHITGQNGPLWLDEEDFVRNNIEIKYQKVGFVPYRQYSKCESFIKGLSVVDLQFNCGTLAKNYIGKGSQYVDRQTLMSTTKLTGR